MRKKCTQELRIVSVIWAISCVALIRLPNVCGQDSIVLAPELPHDVALADPSNPRQEDFDLFSWKSFVALNWPANPDGTPNNTVTIGQETSAKRVWEFFIHPKDVFLPGGATPRWPGSSEIGAGLQASKASPLFRGTTLDALQFPVVDQDKNFVLFDIRLNKDEFDYIVANNLYSKAGQQGASPLAEKFVSFPAGEANGTVGAIEIKTAWRVFPSATASADATKRYFALPAKLQIDAKHSLTGTALELEVALGMVGFHIAHKTKGQPQWVWSTFEHVDNLAAPVSGKPSFTDPACGMCPPNSKPLPPGIPLPTDPNQPSRPPQVEYKWAPTPPYAGPNQRIPTQVTRETPLKASTVQLNNDWQDALRAISADSVWQYYQLISTQWPTKPLARKPGQLPGMPGQPTLQEFYGFPAPPILANIPLETYNQKSSSCIKCHSRAFTRNGDYADFSYLLQLAQ